MWTFVTNGQVASKTSRPRRADSSTTALETPCAEKITVAPPGTSLSSSTNTAPSERRRSTTCRLCTTSCRTYIGGPKSSSARSTISIARSTPAQKPRGLASRICIGVLPSAALEKCIEQHERCSHADCGIGDVERREICVAPVNVNEVDDVAELDAVDHVAKRSAQDQRQAESEQPLRARMQPAQPDDDGNADSERESREKPALPACGVREKAERRPRVVHQGDIENGQ